jgi:CRP/FNR family transcriptional regulator, cyclic AMP receptor protein
MSDDASSHVIQRQTFQDGEVIFEEGSPGDRGYVVTSGSVEIWKHAGEGRVVLGSIVDGGMFGEMALIDNSPRMASATAVEKTECVILTKDELSQHLRTANPFLRLLINMLVRNVRSVSDKLVDAMSENDHL